MICGVHDDQEFDREIEVEEISRLGPHGATRCGGKVAF